MEMDADVRRYVGGYPRSREHAERKFRDGPLKPASDRLGVWATILKPDGPYIGRCGLYPHFLPEGRIATDEAALSFYIARKFWGRGFASEAAAAFVQFGWEDLKLSRIVATVQEGNDVSIHILQKLRFNLVATERGPRSFFKYSLNRPGIVQYEFR